MVHRRFKESRSDFGPRVPSHDLVLFQPLPLEQLGNLVVAPFPCPPFRCFSADLVSAALSTGLQRCAMGDEELDGREIPPVGSPGSLGLWDFLLSRGVSGVSLHAALINGVNPPVSVSSISAPCTVISSLTQP